jgi:hypothetical protein
MEPNIKVVNEDTQRPIVNIGGLPKSSKDVTPVRSNFAIRSNSDSSNSTAESLKKSSSANANSSARFNPQYDLFANARKTSKKKEAESEDGDSGDDDSDDDSGDGSDDDSGDGSDDDSGDGSDDDSRFSKDSVAVSSSDKPKLNGVQLKIKKKELLLKLHEAKKNGYRITGSYNINSDLDEMEAEYELYEKNMGQLAMIDMCQDGLMFIIKGIEYINGMYKPGGVNLSGLSNKIYDRKEQLSHVFKRLAVKYSGGTEMPPELSLLFIIGGAMIMTHIGNTLSKSSNPLDLLSGMFGGNGTMGNIMSLIGSANKQSSNATPANVNSRDIKMKSPNADIASLISSMTNVADLKSNDNDQDNIRDNLPFKAMNVPTPSPFPASSRTKDFQPQSGNSDRFSVGSSSSDSTVETKTVSIPSSKKSNLSGKSNKKTLKFN